MRVQAAGATDASEMDDDVAPPYLPTPVHADRGSAVGIDQSKRNVGNQTNLPLPWLVLLALAILVVGVIAAYAAGRSEGNDRRLTELTLSLNSRVTDLSNTTNARLSDIATATTARLDDALSHTNQNLSDAKKEWRLADNSNTELKALLASRVVMRDKKGQWHIEEETHGRP